MSDDCGCYSSELHTQYASNKLGIIACQGFVAHWYEAVMSIERAWVWDWPCKTWKNKCYENIDIDILTFVIQGDTSHTNVYIYVNKDFLKLWFLALSIGNSNFFQCIIYLFFLYLDSSNLEVIQLYSDAPCLPQQHLLSLLMHNYII